MPKVNFGVKGREFARLFRGYASDMKMSPEKLSRKGFSGDTIRNRYEKPGDFTVDELLYMGRKLEIPIEELRACLKY